MTYMGIDIGGTNTLLGLVAQDGQVKRRVSFATRAPRSAQALCDDIAAACRQLAAQGGIHLASLPWLGVGCPGVIQGGTVLFAGNLAFHHVPLADMLEARLGVPVLLENDGNAAAWGEYVTARLEGDRTLAVIMLGTGIGSGIVCQSRILSGYSGGAPELGHIVISYGGRLCKCGNRGCLEAYCSATALTDIAREAARAHPESALGQTPHGDIRPPLIFGLAGQGDPLAGQLVAEYIDRLAAGLIGLINVVQPDIIRIGGGMSLQGDALLVPLRARVAAGLLRHTRGPDIEQCRLGDDSGLIGAALLGMQGQGSPSR